jgi:hypothetical protein
VHVERAPRVAGTRADRVEARRRGPARRRARRRRRGAPRASPAWSRSSGEGPAGASGPFVFAGGRRGSSPDG